MTTYSKKLLALAIEQEQKFAGVTASNLLIEFRNLSEAQLEYLFESYEDDINDIMRFKLEKVEEL